MTNISEVWSVTCYAARRRWLGTLIKRSFYLAGRRTSVALEQEFWRALEHIALSHEQTLTSLVAEADSRRPEGQPLASALRVCALLEFFSQASTRHANPIASEGAQMHPIDTDDA